MTLANVLTNSVAFFWADSVYWTLFGLVGNVMFTSRFVVQWYASEKLKQSIIPRNFWHLSFAGGIINFIYAIHVWKLPFILGSLLPPVVAARNLMLIARQENRPPPTADDDASATMLATQRAASR